MKCETENREQETGNDRSGHRLVRSEMLPELATALSFLIPCSLFHISHLAAPGDAPGEEGAARWRWFAQLGQPERILPKLVDFPKGPGLRVAPMDEGHGRRHECA